MALAPSRANILPAGISEWGISDTTQSDTGYSAIPYLYEGKLEMKSLDVKNSQGQPMPYAYELSGSAKFPAVRTTANFMKTLDSLGRDLIEHRITLVNGQIISSNPGTSTMSPTGFGTKWKLVSDKDMDGNMFVEIDIMRRLTIAEGLKVRTTANAPTFGTSTTFTNLTSLTRADIVPAGISKVEVGAADAGTYADVISNLRKGVFTAELLTQPDSRGQHVGYAIKIDFAIESMETLEAEWDKWDAIAARANECRITWANGLVCSLPHQLGISYAFETDKDMDDIAYLKVSGSGIVTNASGVWDGLWGA